MRKKRVPIIICKKEIVRKIKDNMRIETHHIVTDTFVGELENIIVAYNYISMIYKCELFGFAKCQRFYKTRIYILMMGRVWNS